jgi:hypothetical protein
MIFNLQNDIERAQAIQKFKTYLDKQKKIELIVKHPKRSIKQNSYLHLLFNYFSIESGYPTDYVKTQFFKRVCNNELFQVILKGTLGEVQHLRSSADLTTDEMSIAISRFKDWSSIEAAIVLPDAEDMKFIEHCENEVSKHSNRIYS